MIRPSSAARCLAAALALAAILVSAASADTQVALQAKIVSIQPSVTEETYSTLEYGKPGSDPKQGTTTWRVVNGTGNCCENYLTISRAGQLLDFGGSYINYSDDRGLSWKSVRPLEPLVNGEGAIAIAPGGDVVGVEWDPYSGDHLLAFKYEASSGTWLYNEMPLHQPFYDREWISVLPGPFTIDGATVPYVTFVKGGVPKEFWFYSTDGVTYTQVSSKYVDQTLNSPPQRTLASTGRL